MIIAQVFFVAANIFVVLSILVAMETPKNPEKVTNLRYAALYVYLMAVCFALFEIGRLLLILTKASQ